jgi:uncharacterized protein YdiU (UPF0061 family)
MTAEPAFAFDNSYARLPAQFYASLAPTPVREPRLVKLNYELAQQLGLDPQELSSAIGIEILSGNRVPANAAPLAMAYAGHQFGAWVPRLGDGRAILLGEVTDRDGARHDVQLKGAGRTPFSRMGDGRAALGPVLREYVVSEGMAALGIPTTRALAIVTTGEAVYRERALPGAILTRVARSHVRVGTFEFFSGQGDIEALRTLADYVIERHYLDIADAAQPYRALLDAVMARQAELVASWMLVGFIHGVMNTDNCSIAGDTIDYGPCAFMDSYHPHTVFSSIDHQGRYAYGNQPRIALWNLARLAQTLLPLLGDDDERAVAEAQEAIDAYPRHYETAWRAGMARKLGLEEMRDDDIALAQDLLTIMAENGADFTLTFRGLSELSAAEPAAEEETTIRSLFTDPGAFDSWALRWRQRLAEEARDPGARRDAMRAANPAFIPRNHLVEEAIRASVDEADYTPFEELMTVLSNPFEDQPARSRYAEPPRPEEVVHQTFCGT